MGRVVGIKVGGLWVVVVGGAGSHWTWLTSISKPAPFRVKSGEKQWYFVKFLNLSSSVHELGLHEKFKMQALNLQNIAYWLVL